MSEIIEEIEGEIKETVSGDFVSFECPCGYKICNDPRPLSWDFCPRCGNPWKRPKANEETKG